MHDSCATHAHTRLMRYSCARLMHDCRLPTRHVPLPRLRPRLLRRGVIGYAQFPSQFSGRPALPLLIVPHRLCRCRRLLLGGERAIRRRYACATHHAGRRRVFTTAPRCLRRVSIASGVIASALLRSGLGGVGMLIRHFKTDTCLLDRFPFGPLVSGAFGV